MLQRNDCRVSVFASSCYNVANSNTTDLRVCVQVVLSQLLHQEVGEVMYTYVILVACVDITGSSQLSQIVSSWNHWPRVYNKTNIFCLCEPYAPTHLPPSLNFTSMQAN
jgi:hypothetical protein